MVFNINNFYSLREDKHLMDFSSVSISYPLCVYVYIGMDNNGVIIWIKCQELR